MADHHDGRVDNHASSAQRQAQRITSLVHHASTTPYNNHAPRRHLCHVCRRLGYQLEHHNFGTHNARAHDRATSASADNSGSADNDNGAHHNDDCGANDDAGAHDDDNAGAYDNGGNYDDHNTRANNDDGDDHCGSDDHCANDDSRSDDHCGNDDDWGSDDASGRHNNAELDYARGSHLHCYESAGGWCAYNTGRNDTRGWHHRSGNNCSWDNRIGNNDSRVPTADDGSRASCGSYNSGSRILLAEWTLLRWPPPTAVRRVGSYRRSQVGQHILR